MLPRPATRRYQALSLLQRLCKPALLDQELSPVPANIARAGCSAALAMGIGLSSLASGFLGGIDFDVRRCQQLLARGAELDKWNWLSVLRSVRHIQRTANCGQELDKYPAQAFSVLAQRGARRMVRPRNARGRSFGEIALPNHISCANEALYSPPRSIQCRARPSRVSELAIEAG